MRAGGGGWCSGSKGLEGLGMGVGEKDLGWREGTLGSDEAYCIACSIIERVFVR